MGLTHTMLLLLGNQGAAGPLPFTDDFARDDGDLDNGWTHAAGKWVISSNALTVTGLTLGSELLSNGNMETGDPPTGWTAVSSAVLSSVADERTGGSGSKAMNIARGTSNQLAHQRPNIGTILQRYFKITGWAREIDDVTPYIAANPSFVLDGAYTTSWESVAAFSYLELNYPFINLWMRSGTAGQQVRFDDVSMRVYTTGELFALRDFSTPNVRASVALTHNSLGAGLIVCADDLSAPANYVQAIVCTEGTGKSVYVNKYVSGARTQLGLINLTGSYSAGKTLALEYAAGVVRVFYDGVQVGVDYAAADAGIIDNTYHGLFSVDESGSFANFTIQTAPT